MNQPAISVSKPETVVFEREDCRWYVEIRPDARQMLNRHRQKRLWSCEAGGQLFGTFHPGYTEIVAATGPSPGDWRSRFGFKPLRKREQEDIHRFFSMGLHFLGNWHTHPSPAPEPSDTDRESIAEEVVLSDHQLPFFLMVIVSTLSDPTTWWMSSHDPEELRFQLRR